MRGLALDALVELIGDLKAARAAGRSDAELAEPRKLQKRAQFYLDFVEAENSSGFHAPEEAARILGESINFSRQAQVSLFRGGAAPPPSTAPTGPANTH
jgi:nitrite reductase (cytochrome c-552)